MRYDYYDTRLKTNIKYIDDLKWASDVLSVACTDAPSSLHLDIRLHVTRAKGLVPTLGHNSDEKSPVNSPIEPVSPIDKFEPLSPTEKNDSLHTSIKGSRADMTTTVEEVSTQEGHVTPSGREHLKVHIGRPDIPAIIQEEIVSSTGPVSVNGKWLNNDPILDINILIHSSLWTFASHEGRPSFFAIWSRWPFRSTPW